MTTCWRCDVCMDLIDPVQGDTRTELEVAIRRDGDASTEAIDLCEDCAPQSAGAHMDWLTNTLEQERAQEVSTT